MHTYWMTTLLTQLQLSVQHDQSCWAASHNVEVARAERMLGCVGVLTHYTRKGCIWSGGRLRSTCWIPDFGCAAECPERTS